MLKMKITAREMWEVLADYEIEAASEEEAVEEIESGKCDYTDYEHLDREVKRIVDLTVAENLPPSISAR